MSVDVSFSASVSISVLWNFCIVTCFLNAGNTHAEMHSFYTCQNLIYTIPLDTAHGFGQGESCSRASGNSGPMLNCRTADATVPLWQEEPRNVPEEGEEQQRSPDPEEFIAPAPPPSYFSTFYSYTPRLARR